MDSGTFIDAAFCEGYLLVDMALCRLAQDYRWGGAAYGDKWLIGKPLLMLEPAHAKTETNN